MNDRSARVLWQLLEPVHTVTYFAPQARAAADAIGLRGYWMSYFAMRAAPLGTASAALVTSTFYGFNPDRVARAIPDAWSYADPATVLECRLDGVDAALRAVLGEETVSSPEVVTAAAIAADAATAAPTGGRALAAANQALPLPEPAHLKLWQALTTLREHRGDGHIAALIAHDVPPIESHILKAASVANGIDIFLRSSRQWSDEQWERATTALRERGWLTADGTITPAGRQAHDEIEALTDHLAAQPYRAIGDTATRTLADLLLPLATAVIDTGLIPVPNPVGLEWPPAAL